MPHLECGGDGDDLLDGAAEPFDVILPVKDGPDVKIHHLRLFGPLAKVMPLDACFRLKRQGVTTIKALITSPLWTVLKIFIRNIFTRFKFNIILRVPHNRLSQKLTLFRDKPHCFSNADL